MMAKEEWAREYEIWEVEEEMTAALLAPWIESLKL